MAESLPDVDGWILSETSIANLQMPDPVKTERLELTIRAIDTDYIPPPLRLFQSIGLHCATIGTRKPELPIVERYGMCIPDGLNQSVKMFCSRGPTLFGKGRVMNLLSYILEIQFIIKMSMP